MATSAKRKSTWTPERRAEASRKAKERMAQSTVTINEELMKNEPIPAPLADTPVAPAATAPLADTPLPANLPNLPDNYTGGSSHHLYCPVVPGYRAIDVRFADNDMQAARAKGIFFPKIDSGFFLEPEILTPSPQGLGLIGDLVIGVEKDSHYAQRIEKDCATPVREFWQRMNKKDKVTFNVSVDDIDDLLES